MHQIKGPNTCRCPWDILGDDQGALFPACIVRRSTVVANLVIQEKHWGESLPKGWCSSEANWGPMGDHVGQDFSRFLRFSEVAGGWRSLEA
jgi:hypothetical protein